MTRLRQAFASIALCVLALSAAPAAEPTGSGWSYRVWQWDDGLPNNNVTSLTQTPDGYIWLATPSRLARFDGDHFEEFSPSQFAPGFTQRITAIVGSRDGGLWLPLDRGPVIRLDHGTVQVISNNLPDLVVETAMEDGQGALWISYRGGRLCRVKDGQAMELSSREGFPNGLAGCYLAADKEGNAWIAKRHEVEIFRNGRFESLIPGGNLATRLTGSRDGGMWICSGLELSKCDDTGKLTRLGTLNATDRGATVTALTEDARGVVWIGTSTSGLFRYDGSDIESVPTSHRDILSLLEDREGNIWVGTAGGGLNRIQPRTVELEAGESGLPFEAIQSLCEDSRGTLWAVTQNGLLATRSNGVWNTVSTNGPLRGLSAECVVADHEGGVWIGGRSRLDHLGDGGLRTWRAANGLSNHIVHALLVARNGDVWIGGEILEKCQNGTITSARQPRDVRMFRALAEDKDGVVWAGSANGYLLRVVGDEVSDETARTYGKPDSIRYLAATPDGSLWIGFATTGLGRLKSGVFSRIGAAQGLGDESISQIVPDGLGWLWIGAEHGIFKVRQAELDSVADGTVPRLQSVHYGRDLGLPSLQANFGFTPGGVRARDGRLWIPLRSALASIDPTRSEPSLAPPPVIMKRVTMDDRTVAAYSGGVPVHDAADLGQPGPAPSLPPGHHRLDFEFTALNFATPENVQFRYRLRGVDDDWIAGRNQRSASYAGLAAGRYQFEVSARQNGGEWNTASALFDFSVRPFFWETWWFRLSAAAAFAAVAIAIGRYVFFRRLRLKLKILEQQAALEKERARIAKDIHDDLGGSLTQTAVLLDLALQDRSAPDKVGAHVNQAAATLRRVVESVDEIVWAANPRNDTLADLVDYICLFAVQFLEAASIRCRIDSPPSLPDVPLSPEARHNLFLVAKEALNNVVRHARAREVRLRVTVTGNSLRLDISDDGRGFNGDHRDNGGCDGLRNMRQRMTEIGGAFRLDSKPQAGTRISAVYPWPRQS
jgi:signal transduction histidine kinase/ligand-binding sensor domain-containing protein